MIESYAGRSRNCDRIPRNVDSFYTGLLDLLQATLAVAMYSSLISRHQEWLDTQGLAIVEAGFDRAVSLAQILDFDDC